MGATKAEPQQQGASSIAMTASTAAPPTNSSTTTSFPTTANPPPSMKNGKPYGRIVLTLKNQLLPEDKLAGTPSQIDGLDADTETDLRIYGCELIQTAGILLRLPQVAMATGQVLLQRFYYSKSLVRHPVEHTAMACVCLASKIEEAPRRARDVINVFTHIRQVNSNKPIGPVVLDQNYIQLKNQVIKAERRVLKELGFCVHIKHPHKIIVMYLQVLCLETHANLMQYSWNYMNDSLRTDAFVRHQPETVACACIYLTARKLRLPLPRQPAWYTIFGVDERDIRDVCVRILRLYNRPKPNVDELERKVDELCRRYQDAKLKAKGSSGANTPNHHHHHHHHHRGSGSPAENNNAATATTAAAASQKTTGAHNAWGGFISRSGSHLPPTVTGSGGGGNGAGGGVNEKNHKSKSKSRSRSRSMSHSPKRSGNKRSKKHKSRSRSPKRKSHKGGRRSYSRSRSRSGSPHKRKSRRKSRSASNERENNRYIDRYDKYGDRYKEDKYEKDRYDDSGGGKDSRKKYDDRYSSRRKHRDDDKDRERSKDRSKDRRR